MEPGAAQDAGELLARCDAAGRPLAPGARRDVVHREGLWHRSFHCWVVRAGARGPELLLQRRSLGKDTWPGAWDVSAAGHYRPGEELADGCREIAEELGLQVAPRALRPLWRHREVLRYASGLHDREYQDVCLVLGDCTLDDLAPDPAEVDGVAYLPAAALPQLAAGQFRRLVVPGRLAARDGWHAAPVTLTRANLVPRMGHYYAWIARAAAAALRPAAGGGGRSRSSRRR